MTDLETLASETTARIFRAIEAGNGIALKAEVEREVMAALNEAESISVQAAHWDDFERARQTLMSAQSKRQKLEDYAALAGEMTPKMMVAARDRLAELEKAISEDRLGEWMRNAGVKAYV